MDLTEKGKMKTIRLNNGVEIPQIGLGSYMIPKELLSKTIGEAYNLGYRQIDTAWKYFNEADIANALIENGIKREEMFITTKVNTNALYVKGYHYGKKGILKNIRNFKSISDIVQESFDNLNTDYVDLFLVHWPWPNNVKLYKELEKLYKRGRIRAIGISNYTPLHIKALIDECEIIPAVNQVEISPLNSQKRLISYCKSLGIAVEAMSTFSHFHSTEPRLEILENPLLQEIALRYGKSVVQIVLRWMIQQDIIVIPKTWNPKYLKENISVEDFCLQQTDMDQIDSLDGGKCLNYNPYQPHVIKYLSKKYRGLDYYCDSK